MIPRVLIVMKTDDGTEMKATVKGWNAMLAADGLIADFEKLGYHLVSRREK